MIEWLREKFSSIICFFFVLSIIAITVAGAIIGQNLFDTVGCIFGIIIGLLIGTLLGILSFGLFATILDIAETTNASLAKLNSISKFENLELDDSDLLRKLSNIEEAINKIQNTLDGSGNHNSKTKNKTIEASKESEKPEDNQDKEELKYQITTKNGRTFATRDGKLYCPKCHSFVDSDSATSCSNCGASFVN